MPLAQPLDVTFSLTPQNMSYYISADRRAYMQVKGASFLSITSQNFNTQYASDKLFFWWGNAANPALDYTSWVNLRTAPRVWLHYNFSGLGEHKELALVFSFEVIQNSRLLIYSDAGLLDDEALIVGDNQILMEVETLDPLDLYFIHSQLEGLDTGGQWFFKGVAGYVV